MKKLLLFCVSSLMALMGYADVHTTYTVTGTGYDDATKSFTGSSITVDVAVSGYGSGYVYYSPEVIANYDSNNKPQDKEVVVFYTTDGTEPSYWNYNGIAYEDDGLKQIKNPVTISGTGVLRTATYCRNRYVEYSEKQIYDDDHYTIIGFGNTYEGQHGSNETTCYYRSNAYGWNYSEKLGSSYQSFLHLPVAAPAIEVKGKLYNSNYASFINDASCPTSAAVNISNFPTYLNGYFGVKTRYSVDGSDPVANGTDYSNAFTLAGTSDIRAAYSITAYGTNGEAQPVSSSVAQQKVTALDVQDVQSAVYTSAVGDYTLTKGQCLIAGAKYNGHTGYVLSDGTTTFLVEDPATALTVGTWYEVGGLVSASCMRAYRYDADENPLYINEITAPALQLSATPTEIIPNDAHSWYDNGTDGMNASPMYNITVRSDDFSTYYNAAHLFGDGETDHNRNWFFCSYAPGVNTDGITDGAPCKITGTLLTVYDRYTPYFYVTKIEQQPEELMDATPAISKTNEGDTYPTNLDAFVESAKVSLSATNAGSNESIILYTTDGTNPTYMVDSKNVIVPTETTKQYTGEITIDATTTVKAIELVKNINDWYTNQKVAAATYTRLQPTDIQTAVFDNAEGTLVLTKGEVLQKITDRFYIVSDSEHNMLVESKDALTVGGYYYFGGQVAKRNANVLINLFYVNKLSTEGIFTMPQQTITADNLAEWVKSDDPAPIYNAEITIPELYVSSYSSDLYAEFGNYELKLMLADGVSTSGLYTGKAIIDGSIIEHSQDDKTVYVYVTGIKQAPQYYEQADPVIDILGIQDVAADANEYKWSLTSTHQNFIEKVSVKLSVDRNYTSHAGNNDNVKIFYTTDGTNPTYATDEDGNVIATGSTKEYSEPFDVTVSTVLKSIVTVGTFTNGEIACDTLTRMEPVSVQTFVYGTEYGQLGLTEGLVVENIAYNGDVYSIVTDGSAYIAVKNGHLEVGKYYFIGGRLTTVNGILGINGDYATYYHEYWSTDNQLSSRPAYISAENVTEYLSSQHNCPLFNVAMTSTDFKAVSEDATATTAKIGDTTLNLIGNISGYDPQLFDGDAVIEGTVFGVEGTSDAPVLDIYVFNIIQKPAAIVSEPEFNMDLEYAVDASEDATVTYQFPADKMTINDANLDAASLKGDVTWSLRTRDGNIIKQETQKDVTLADVNTITLSADDINTGSEYYVTIDGVIIYNNVPQVCNVQSLTAVKNFTTEEGFIADAAMSYFPAFTVEDAAAMKGSFSDPAFTVEVEGAKTVAVNAASSIYLVSAVDHKVKFTPTAVTANGNELTFNLSDLSDIPYTEGLAMGSYQVVIPAQAISIDGMYNPERITFTLTVGNDEDKARLSLMKAVDECQQAYRYAPCGVNIFQYTPVVYDKFAEAIHTAWDEAYDIRPEADQTEQLKSALTALDAALGVFQPTLPEVNDTYVIWQSVRTYNEETGEYELSKGKYLSINEAEKPCLSDEPSYFQFHATKAAEPGTPYSVQGWSWYLYNTPTRQYLGYQDAHDMYGTLNLSTRTVYPFKVACTSYNDWAIFTEQFRPLISYNDTAYIYYSRDLYDAAMADAEAYIASAEGQEELKDYKEGTDEYTAKVNSIKERYFRKPMSEWAGSTWYIEKADAPQAGTDSEDGDSEATAITSAQAASMNATFYSTSGVRRSAAEKGINIVRFADGSVKKVMVK